MKWLFTLLVCVILGIAFMHALDREITRQEYLVEASKALPGRLNNCMFQNNCRYYNNLLKGMTR